MAGIGKKIVEYAVKDDFTYLQKRLILKTVNSVPQSGFFGHGYI